MFTWGVLNGRGMGLTVTRKIKDWNQQSDPSHHVIHVTSSSTLRLSDTVSDASSQCGFSIVMLTYHIVHCSLLTLHNDIIKFSSLFTPFRHATVVTDTFQPNVGTSLWHQYQNYTYIYIYMYVYIYICIYIYKYTFIYPGCVWKWGMPPISSHFHRENDDEKSMDFGIPCFQTNLSGLFACSGLVFTTRWSHAKRSAHAAYKRMLGLCPKMSSMHLTYAPDHGHYKMTLSCVKHRWFVNLKSLLRITLGNCLYKWSI